MNSEILFSQALGLQSPWKVEDIRFSNDNISAESELHIYLGFESGKQFVDESGVLCPVHDTVDRKWQHLNFFEHSCLLHCAVPRIKTTDGKVRTVEVPWARPGSGFTLLFEALIMMMAKAMPVKSIADIIKEHDTRLWRVLNHYVHESNQKY